MYFLDGHPIKQEEEELLLKVLNYPFEKFLRKVCDYEFDHKGTEVLMNDVVLKFKDLKEKAARYVELVRSNKEFLESFLRDETV